MNLFESHFDTADLAQAKKQLAEDWKSYCADELNSGVFADIDEARTMEELVGIRVFLWSFSSVMKAISGSDNYGDYGLCFEDVISTIKGNDCKKSGADISEREKALLERYGL